MTETRKILLERLDRDRRLIGEDDLDRVLREEVARAEASGRSVRWEVYGFDRPANLSERLLLAGFHAEPREQSMFLRLEQDAIDRFPPSDAIIRRIRQGIELHGVAEISAAIGRSDVVEERERLEATLARDPEHMSVYVAEVNGRPAACGRIHFDEAMPELAYLSGGRTHPSFRNRGLHLALVRARLLEALERGREVICVDALPTSEAAFRKRGFGVLTWKQEFVYVPGRARVWRSSQREP